LEWFAKRGQLLSEYEKFDSRFLADVDALSTIFSKRVNHHPALGTAGQLRHLCFAQAVAPSHDYLRVVPVRSTEYKISPSCLSPDFAFYPSTTYPESSHIRFTKPPIKVFCQPHSPNLLRPAGQYRKHGESWQICVHFHAHGADHRITRLLDHCRPWRHQQVERDLQQSLFFPCKYQRHRRRSQRSQSSGKRVDQCRNRRNYGCSQGSP